MTLDVFTRHPLPEHWEWRKLGEICYVADRDHRTPTYQEDGVPLISPRDFTEHGVDLSRLKRVAPAELEAFRKKCRPEKGDIMYSRIGTIGEPRLVDFDLDFVALHSIAMIKPRLLGLQSKYVLYLLQSPAVRSQAKHNVKSVGTPDLGLKRIKDFEIPVAPPHVQEKIVADIEKQFSRLDEAVANLKRVKANLKRYIAAVLTDSVDGQLARDRRTWTRNKLGDVALSVRNGVSEKPDADSGTRILRISAVRPLELDDQDVRYLRGPLKAYEVFRLEAGDVLFTRYNGNVDLVGACAVVPHLTQPTVYPDKLIRVRVPPSVLLPAFLAICASTGEGRAFIESRIRTTAGQAGISGADIKRFPILIPPRGEQERIVAEVARRLSLVREMKSEVDANLKRAQALRRACLSRVFGLAF